jgi:hypothetical protein
MRRSARVPARVADCLGRCPRAGAGEVVGAAQRVGYPEPAGHVAYQLRRVGGRHPRGSDERRAGGGPRSTWMACTAVRNPVLARPITGMPNSACARRPSRAGRPVPGRRARRPPAALTRRCCPRPRAVAAVPAGRTHRAVRHHLGHHPGAPGQHLREDCIGGHHGRGPGTARPEVVHVHGGAQPVHGMPASAHALRMPAPAEPNRPSARQADDCFHCRDDGAKGSLPRPRSPDLPRSVAGARNKQTRAHPPL